MDCVRQVVQKEGVGALFRSYRWVPPAAAAAAVVVVVVAAGGCGGGVWGFGDVRNGV
jgi:hypothetical protein